MESKIPSFLGEEIRLGPASLGSMGVAML
jgi:hypothetical protein